MMQETRILYQDTIPGRRYWSFTIKREHSLGLVDAEGGTNVGMPFYNPYNPLEHYNFASSGCEIYIFS